jgi:hypothetical protein
MIRKTMMTALIALFPVTAFAAPFRVVGPGQTCGGAALPPEPLRVCEAGLTCRNDANDSTFPGICVLVGELGETCGGASLPGDAPVVCDFGLVCRNEANDSTFPGTCVPR